MKEEQINLDKQSKLTKLRLVGNRSILLVVALLFLVIIATRDFAVSVITKLWVIPVMSKMYEGALWYFIFASTFLIVYYSASFIMEKYKSHTRIWILISISVLYGLCLLYSKFEPTKGWNFSVYSGLIFITPFVGEFILYIKRKNNSSVKEERCSLIFEKPIRKGSDDFYDRNNYSEVIAKRINNNFHKEGAFVIGLAGSWGYGKTSFLNMIHDDINKKGIDVIFEFKPWLSSSTASIVPDFMKQLAEKLSLYVPSLKNKLRKYAEAVSELNDDPFLKSTFNVINISYTDSPEKQYENIKEILLASKLKVLVFIDDTDRLSPEEILEVLKLVRNSANFPYMQFVIAYDRDYVLESLKSDSYGWKIANPDSYLEKIFNVELSLPSFEYDTLNNKLIKELKYSLAIDEIHKEEISAFFDNRVEGFPTDRIIKTNRDVIRFANALSINIEALQKSFDGFSLTDIDIVDFVKIELIRYRYPNYYNRLLNNPLSELELSKGNKDFFIYRLDEAEANEKQEANQIKDINDILPDEEDSEMKSTAYVKEDDLLSICMMNLFPRTPLGNNKSISNLRSFNQYFRYRYDDKNISQSEIISLLNEKSQAKQSETLEVYFAIKKGREVYNMFRSLIFSINEDFWKEENHSSPFYYKKILRLIDISFYTFNEGLMEEVSSSISRLFHYTKYPNMDYYIEVLKIWDNIMLFNLMVNDSIISQFIYENSLKSRVDTDITNEDIKKIEGFLRSVQSLEQMSKLLYYVSDPDNRDYGLVLEKSTLKEIQVSYFMKYSEKNIVDRQLEQLFIYSANLEQGTRKFLWNEKASGRFKELIDIDASGYIKLFFGYDDFFIYPNGYWKALFDEQSEKVDEYLFDNKKDNIEDIKWARLIWNIYKHNNYEEIQINNLPYLTRDRDEFLSNLEKDYNSILEIEIEIKKTLPKAFQKDFGEHVGYYYYYDDKQREEIIEKLDDMRGKLSSVSLHINLVNELSNKLENYWKEITSTKQKGTTR